MLPGRGQATAAPTPAPVPPVPAGAPGAAHALPGPWSLLRNRTVMVSALGYFVDSYDLLLFTIVRVPSLRGLGVPEEQMLSTGVLLLNAQLVGLLVGGLLWGVLGDRRGRVTVLFGSIFLYSAANLANAFVTDIPSYAALRFLAGVGLAGELGIAITLVAEVTPAHLRGFAGMLVIVVGVPGAILAAAMAALVPWQWAYALGGLMGFALLALRWRIAESGLYARPRTQAAVRGSFRLLLRSGARARRYLATVVLGVPTWFVLGIVVTFSPEIAAALGTPGVVSAGMAAVAFDVGLVAGNLACPFLSRRLRSRWWTVLAYLAALPACTFALVLARGLDLGGFYALLALMGLAVGYWAVFLTMAAESFGTNLRATVVTTAPNFSRGAAVPMALAFQALVPVLGVPRAVLAVGAACTLVALLALRALDETYGRELDFIEE